MTYDRQIVRRDLAWPSGLPSVSGDCRVLALRADSRSVPVGAAPGDLHWIPSRTRILGEARIDALFAEFRGQGFDIECTEVMGHAADNSPESGKDTQ